MSDYESSWVPVDLTEVLSGIWQPPTPTVGRRSDKVGLFYPGKLHTVSSETEAGKTWFALVAAAQELLNGNDVSYFDFEDDQGSVVGRLLTLQVPAQTIKERFHYVRPIAGLTDPDVAVLHGIMVDHHPTLAVIDGVTEAMTMHNLKPDNYDIALFGDILPRKLSRSGCATVCLDHVTKSTEGRGRYAIGGVHKLNGIDGAAYVLENRHPFGVGLKGVSTIRIAKDRPGQLRRHAVKSTGMHWFGDLIIDTSVQGQADGVWTIAPPIERDPEFRPTVMMARMAEVLACHPEGLSQRVWCQGVKGGTEVKRSAVSFLILDGYATPKTPHKLIRNYPDSEDEQ